MENREEPTPAGCCGEEFWIADELWQMSMKRTPENKERFQQAIRGLIVVSQQKPRRCP